MCGEGDGMFEMFEEEGGDIGVRFMALSFLGMVGDPKGVLGRDDGEVLSSCFWK